MLDFCSCMRHNFLADIKLRTRTRRKLPMARQFYIEFSVGEASPQSTTAAKEAKNETSWDQVFYL